MSLLAKLYYYTHILAHRTMHEDIIDNDTPQLFPELSPWNFKDDIIKMCSALAILLTCFFIGAWAFKKLISSKVTRQSSQSMMQIIDKMQISQKSIIYLVQVNSKLIVLGETEHKLSFLTELPSNTAELSNTPNSRQQQTTSSLKDLMKTIRNHTTTLKCEN